MNVVRKKRRLVRLISAVVVLVGLAWQAPEAEAQDGLTLQEAIQLAQEQSPDLKAVRADLARSGYERELTASQYLPEVSLQGSLPGLQRSINEVTQPDGSVEYIPQSRLSSTSHVAVTQQLPWMGTEVFVSSRLGRLDVFGSRDYTQWNSAPVVVGITQPLFQFNQMKWERRLAPLRYEAAERRTIQQRAAAAEEAAARFFDAYVAQLAARDAASRVAVNDSIRSLAEQRYRIGSTDEHQFLQSELQLINARDALEQARAERQKALASLSRAVGVPLDTMQQLVVPEELPAVDVEPADAVRHAREFRPAVAEMDLQVMQAESEIARAERQSSFSASITASYGLNQRGPSFAGAFQDPLDQQRFGVDFNIPIFSWGKSRARVEAAKASLEAVRMEAAGNKEELDEEVYNAVVDLKTLRRRVELAQQASEIASRRFESTRRQFMTGNLDVAELFMAQQELDEARQQYYSRLRAFWVSYYHLQRLTLYDAAAGRPLSGTY